MLQTCNTKQFNQLGGPTPGDSGRSASPGNALHKSGTRDTRWVVCRTKGNPGGREDSPFSPKAPKNTTLCFLPRQDKTLRPSGGEPGMDPRKDSRHGLTGCPASQTTPRPRRMDAQSDGGGVAIAGSTGCRLLTDRWIVSVCLCVCASRCETYKRTSVIIPSPDGRWRRTRDGRAAKVGLWAPVRRDLHRKAGLWCSGATKKGFPVCCPVSSAAAAARTSPFRQRGGLKWPSDFPVFGVRFRALHTLTTLTTVYPLPMVQALLSLSSPRVFCLIT